MTIIIPEFNFLLNTLLKLLCSMKQVIINSRVLLMLFQKLLYLMKQLIINIRTHYKTNL